LGTLGKLAHAVALNSAPHASVTTLSQGFSAISSLLSSVVIFFTQILNPNCGPEKPATLQ
jgi:hypothetical protein